MLPGASVPRQKTSVMIAMTLSSLVAGLLVVINCDRTIHLGQAAKQGLGTSLHGWPVVYLERKIDSLELYLARLRPYDWPLPSVKGEVRTMNYQNLMIDVVCGLAIVAVCFVLIYQVVSRYERWKSTW